MNTNYHRNEIKLVYEPRREILPKLSKCEGEPEMSEFESAFLCGVLHRFCPEKIVEVGIAGGATTAIILQCMTDLGRHFELHSIDLSERFWQNNEQKSGYLGVEADAILKTRCEYEHSFHLGNVAPFFKDEIGTDIDCLILDTAHKSPGEILDFITMLPMLKNGCVVILHDIILSHITPHIKTDKYATAILFSAVTGEKFINYRDDKWKQGLPNIAAFVVNEDTRDKIADCFMSLLVPWGYIPGKNQIDEYRKAIEMNYDEALLQLFDSAVSVNEETVIANRMQITFPIQAVPGRCKLVLYGAGMVGKIFREQLKGNTNINVVKWVDQRYNELSDLNIDSVESICDTEFDVIVIAIESFEVASQVKDNLIKMGIDEERIVWRNPRLI